MLAAALRILHRAGVIRALLPGMRLRDWRVIDGGRSVYLPEQCFDAVPSDVEPDLTDPATIGCLTALLREATGDDHVTVAHPSHNLLDDPWCVWAGGGAMVLGQGPSEGEALKAALLNLAASVPE